MDLRVAIVDDHPKARRRTEAFLASCDAPALIIAGGGGGTLRAVIEGVCEGREPGQLPGPERVRVAALRMGSGNLLARQFGMPRDPEVGLSEIVANLHRDRTVPCCIVRYEVGRRGAAPQVCHAATLGGFGQFGRVPRDLERWHRRLRWLYRPALRLLNIERLTYAEYGLALLIRSIWCALRPEAAEVVTVRLRERVESMRLLAGAVMSFPFRAPPFAPDLRAEEGALSLTCVPYRGRRALFLLALSPRRLSRNALRVRISAPDDAEICLKDRDSAGFFLDEDAMVFHGRIKIQVAGALAFVPGPEYARPSERERRPCPFTSLC